MWPTNHTLLYLILGLVPLLFVARWVSINGIQELLRFRSIGVILTWVGYQYAPWAVYFSGKPFHNFLLVSGYLDKGIVFSALCMIFFMAGASFKPMPQSHAFPRVRATLMRPVRIELIVLAFVLSLGTLLMTTGGIGELLHSAHPRGWGQFDERVTFLSNLLQMVNATRPLIDLALAVGSASLLFSSRASLFQKTFAWVGILTSMLENIHDFSRAAGWPLCVVAAYAFVVGSKHKWLIGTTCVLVFAWLGSIGYHGRGLTNPGIMNFAEVASHPEILTEQAAIATKSSEDTDYPFDAMSPWTRKAFATDLAPPDLFRAVAILLQQLDPLPSELTHPPTIGEDLAITMGTYGSTGITTPALGEIYWVGGFTSLWIPFLAGLTFNYVERIAVWLPSFWGWLMRLMCFLCFPISLHQGIRGASRPLIYCLIGYFLWRFFAERRHPVATHATTAATSVRMGTSRSIRTI